MLKKVMLSVLLFGLVACGDPEWTNYGSMYGLDRQEWIAASGEKQLGTAGYYLRKLQQKGFLKDESATEGEAWFVNAVNLTDCLNKRITYSNKETSYLVSDCVQSLGLAK